MIRSWFEVEDSAGRDVILVSDVRGRFKEGILSKVKEVVEEGLLSRGTG